MADEIDALFMFGDDLEAILDVLLTMVEHRVRAFLTYGFKKRFIKNTSHTGLNFNQATV